MENKENVPVKEIKMSEEAVCQSCGKFVGPYEKCPYCQADMKKRLSLRLVKRISVIGSIVGLIMLWYASKMQEIPVVKVSSITERMNNALVEVTGAIVAARFDETKNNFSYTVADETGKIKLAGFNALNDFKKAFGDNLPQEGDKIRVAGQLNISEKYGVSMFIKNPKRIVITEKYVISEKKIKNITKADVKKVFKLKVKIEEVGEFTVGKDIEVKDNTGSMQLTVFNSQYEMITDTFTKTNLISPGAVFEMTAIVDTYRDKLQLRLRSPENPKNLKCIKAGSRISAGDLQINEDKTPATNRTPKKRDFTDEKANIGGGGFTFEEEKPNDKSNDKPKDKSGDDDGFIIKEDK